MVRTTIFSAPASVVQFKPMVLAIHVRDVVTRSHPSARIRSRVADVRHVARDRVLRMAGGRVAHCELERASSEICSRVHREEVVPKLVDVLHSYDQGRNWCSNGLVTCERRDEQGPDAYRSCVA